MENHKARERRKTIKQGKPYRRLTGWELHLIPRLRRYLGMIQQEIQNNIINILGGHSYAM